MATIVLMHGATSGTTIGRTSNLESYRRIYPEYGIVDAEKYQ